jgi:hypothetical protein
LVDLGFSRRLGPRALFYERGFSKTCYDEPALLMFFLSFVKVRMIFDVIINFDSKFNFLILEFFSFKQIFLYIFSSNQVSVPPILISQLFIFFLYRIFNQLVYQENNSL